MKRSLPPEVYKRTAKHYKKITKTSKHETLQPHVERRGPKAKDPGKLDTSDCPRINFQPLKYNPVSPDLQARISGYRAIPSLYK